MTGIPPASRYRIIISALCYRRFEEITAVVNTKIVAFLVIAVLSVSIVMTGVAAIYAAQVTAQDQPLAGSSAEEREGDSALVSSFKFVCPFH